jgi:aminomethyltransferase
MLQHRFTGGSSQAFLMSLTPSSLHSLKPYTSTLSVLLNEHGGIIDDTIITKQANDDTWYVVTNAGRIKEDVAHISAKLEAWNAKSENQVDGQKVQWEKMEGRGLLALQGPKSAEVLQSITKGVQLDEMNFGQAAWAQVGKEGVECHIARGGYTGEDGFEVSYRSSVYSLGAYQRREASKLVASLTSRSLSRPRLHRASPNSSSPFLTVSSSSSVSARATACAWKRACVCTVTT